MPTHGWYIYLRPSESYKTDPRQSFGPIFTKHEVKDEYILQSRVDVFSSDITLSSYHSIIVAKTLHSKTLNLKGF